MGNVRLSYQDINNDGSVDSSEILQERNYYPFRMQRKGYNNVVVGAENNYKTYQSKEFEKELGLGWHDFGARRYMTDIGRWLLPDLLAKEFPEWSPYNFTYNNPIRYNDPTGLAPEDWVATFNDDGTKTWEWKEEIRSAKQAKEAGYDDYKSPNDNYSFIDIEGTKQILGDGKVIMDNPLQQHLYSDKTLTLDEWVTKNGTKSQSELALEIGKDKFGLPLGPIDRYVINPHDGNVMDMRHVAVVGYAMGEVNGLGAEVIQKIAGFLGKDPTNSAFNPQDKYSNNIGSSFFNYDFHTNGLDMSNNFGERLQTFLNKVYENNSKN